MNRLLSPALCVALFFLAGSWGWGADDISTNVGTTGKAVTRTLILPDPIILNGDLSAYVSSGVLMEGDAARLVDATVCAAIKCSTDTGAYVLINLVNWGRSSTSSNWYIFRGGSGRLSSWRANDFDGGQRLYGAKRTLLLSIQLSPRYPAGTPAYVVTESKRVPTNFQHLADLLGVIAPPAKGGGKSPTFGVFWTGGAVPRKYPTADIAIKTTIPRPIAPAAPKEDLGPTTGHQGPAQNSGAAVPHTSSRVKGVTTGGGPHTSTDTYTSTEEQQPGDIKPNVPQPQPGDPTSNNGTVVGAVPDTSSTSGDVAMPDYSLTDESKAWWDLSIAVPVKKVSALQYNSTNGIVTTTPINKQNVFAVVDLYLPPKDLVGIKYSFIPHPLFGVSMASKPLQSLLFAGAIGLSFGEVYVGANLLKQQSVTGLSAGSTATPQQLSAATNQKFQSHFTIGINLSIKSAFGAAANGAK